MQRFGCLLALWMGMASSGVHAQSVVAPLSIARTVDVGGAAGGLDVDPATGDVYIITDNGQDITRVGTDNSVTRIVNNGGAWQDNASDLRISDDGIIHILSTAGAMAGTVHRFQLDGTALEPLAMISDPGGLLFSGEGGALDFDCVGNVVTGDADVELFRVTPAGTVGSHSTGWSDVDELVRGFNNELFALDPATLLDGGGADKVFRIVDGGAISVFARTLDTPLGGLAVDRGTRQVFVAAGNHIVRLTDTDDDGVSDGAETIGMNFGALLAPIRDIDFGRSSGDPTMYSLYVIANPALDPGQLYEITGFAPPPSTDCGESIDDDGDGFCEEGSDTNGDGDCLDDGERALDSDCDDGDVTFTPGSPEATVALCTDGIENDCDGDTDVDDADCAIFLDMDGDGFCPNGEDTNGDGDCLDPGEVDGAGPFDCDDTVMAIFPGADENTEALCSDRDDNDCDGDTDLSDVDCGDYSDDDGDGFCELGEDRNGDGGCFGAVELAGPRDCNDMAAAAFPGNAENCTDGIDNDCDTFVDLDDDECADTNDDDGDGYCEAGVDLNMDGDCEDAGEPGGPGDCNDGDAAVNPDATELCSDAIDNECDGLIDGEDADDCGDFYDDDGDGYCEVGRDANMDGDCLDPGEPDGPSDCNDMNSEVNPGHTEVTEAECMNLLDDDCDLTIDAADPGCDSFSDPDGDGYCPMGRDLNMDGDCLDDEEMGGDGPFDCAEGNADINPDAAEVCDDGVDNDCNGLIDAADAGVCGDLFDNDGDGVCEMGRDMNADGDCADDGEDDGGVDCNDDNASMSPDLPEICGDGLDNDCDGLVDGDDVDDCDGSTDGDGDGWCGVGMDTNMDGDCLDDGEDIPGGDCNDSDASINPDATEICTDGIDNDCDALIDDADSDCSGGNDFLDSDGDGYCPMGTDLNMDGDCLDDGETEGMDCDDTMAGVNPGAAEVCGDGIDNDCNGAIDDGCNGGVTGGACAAGGAGSGGLLLALLLLPLLRRRED